MRAAQLSCRRQHVRCAVKLSAEIYQKYYGCFENVFERIMLLQKRKSLVNGKFKDRHFNMGSILLASGVIIAIEGCLNTWSRTGKLFPGPHLFAGASIVALWALAAALVPAMQKGNEAARNAHIALNAANVSLFIWQIPTGYVPVVLCSNASDVSAS